MTKHALVIFLAAMTIGVQSAGQEPPSSSRASGETPLCQFTARVTSIEMVGNRPAKAIPVGGVDLHWLVRIEILSIERSAKPFEKGQASLLIHSPALFFSGRTAEEPIGEEYSFDLFGEVQNGVPEYVFGYARPKVASGPGPNAVSQTPVVIVDTTVCDLLNRPLEFANKHVRVRSATAEGLVLFPVDDECSAPPSTNLSIWLETTPYRDIAMYDRGWSTQRFIQALGAGLLKGDGPNVAWQVPAALIPLDPEQWKTVSRALDESHRERIQVIVTGRFDYAGDGLLVKSPDGHFQLWGGFGHLGSWPQRIVLERIQVAATKQ